MGLHCHRIGLATRLGLSRPSCAVFRSCPAIPNLWWLTVVFGAIAIVNGLAQFILRLEKKKKLGAESSLDKAVGAFGGLILPFAIWMAVLAWPNARYLCQINFLSFLCGSRSSSAEELAEECHINVFASGFIACTIALIFIVVILGGMLVSAVFEKSSGGGDAEEKPAGSTGTGGSQRGSV